MFLIGFGAHLVLAATMTEFTSIASEKEKRQPGSMGSGGAYAQSYSLFNMSWALGSLIGSYLAGYVREAASWGTMGWTYAILCSVVAIPAFLYCGGGVGDAEEQRQERKRIQSENSNSMTMDFSA